MIQTWELWAKEFENASKFFKSAGGPKTKSKLKDKWYNDFMKMIQKVKGDARK